MRRIQSINLVDTQGRSVVLHDKEILLVTESYSHQLRNVLSILLKRRKLFNILDLLEVWVHSKRLARNTSCLTSEILAIWKAKVRFLRKLIDLDISTVELQCDGVALKFKLDDRCVLWQMVEATHDIVQLDQYNLQPENAKGMVLMDIGAHLGVFAILGAKLGAKKVYAFEPVRSTYEILVRNIQMNDVSEIVIPINKGLGEKSETRHINFLYEGDAAACFDPASLSKDPSRIDDPTSRVRVANSIRQECQMTTVDEFVEEQGVSPNFIKIDTEGYEKKVILGARNTIRDSRPLLAMSAYHRKSDPEELLSSVLSIRKDYRCQLLERAERVLYFY